MGARGVVLLSNSRGVYPSDDSLTELWDGLYGVGATVFLHPTSSVTPRVDRPRPPPPSDGVRLRCDPSPGGVADVGDLAPPPAHPTDRHPLGSRAPPSLIDRADMFHGIMRSLKPEGDPAKDVPDLVDSVLQLWFDCAGTPAPTGLRHLIDKVGDDHVDYGSDFCFTPAHALEPRSPRSTRSAWPTGDR